MLVENVAGKGQSDEASGRNEERATENWRKCKAAKNLAELCSHPRVLWKLELARNELYV